MNSTEPSPPRLEERFRQCALLVALYSIPPFLVILAINVLDADLWWHLRTGDWIIQHGSVPYSDSFSWTEMGKPWAAYSWLFEVLIQIFFSRFGLLGILVYTYVLLIAITAALHSLIRKFEGRLAHSVGLTALSLIAMTRIWGPRPWLFTILFFCIELNILVSVRRSRNYRRLFLLVPLFAFWANLHIQFVYGFFVLGLALIEAPLSKLLRKRFTFDVANEDALPVRWMILVILACTAALVLNPYHVRIFAILVDTIRLGGLYDLISELQALPFRALPDWLVLFLGLAAAFAMGFRRNATPFWVLLFAGAAFVSFRGNRDVWFVVIVSATIVARSGSRAAEKVPRLAKSHLLIVAAGIVLLVLLIVRAFHITNAELQRIVDESYPASAAAFVEQRALQGPLCNHLNWGGYLVWRLPQLPVSIDGRSNIHEPTRLKNALEVWRGKPGWESDTELSACRLVIAQRGMALTELLRKDPRFSVAYKDDISVVFTKVQ